MLEVDIDAELAKAQTAPVANVSIGTCSDSSAYCMDEACTDATFGTDCKCMINGVESTLPIGCMESAQIVMAVPSSLELKLPAITSASSHSCTPAARLRTTG